MPTVYAAMEEGLLVASGDPGDWQARVVFDRRPIDAIAVHPDEPGRVFCACHEDGLWRSEAAIDSWERVGAEAVDEPVSAVTVSPHDPEAVWVGTDPSQVYRSIDGGETFERREGLTDLPSEPEWSFPPRPDTHHVRWIEVDPHDPEHLYVSIEAGALVRTRDAGETWIDRVPGACIDNHTLTTHPDAPGRAWAAAGDGYAETDDGGETWTHPEEGLEHTYCWDVAVDAIDPDLALVSSASGSRTAHTYETADSYVYRKRGENGWERLDDRGLPTGEGVTRAELEPGTDAGEFYALHNHGIYRTTDTGDSWTRLDVTWPDAFETGTAHGLVVGPRSFGR